MVGRLAPFPLVVAGAALAGLLMRNARKLRRRRHRCRFSLANARRRHRAMGRARDRCPAACRAGFPLRRYLPVLHDGSARDFWWSLRGARLGQPAGGGGLRLAHAGRGRRRSRACRDDARAPDHRAAIRRLHGGLEPAGLAAPPAAATIAALLSSWATFLPSFVFILVGAPYGEKLSSNVRLSTALAGMTAAVVGVIGSLAIALGAMSCCRPDWAPRLGRDRNRYSRLRRAAMDPSGCNLGHRGGAAAGSRWPSSDAAVVLVFAE